ncbi:MAG: hypothetical protein GX442_06565 [Candidatus Riflebacteria bacterium]|nr:hypothetical protein [Candidatus Riflebacteria bacterium]
MASQRPGPIPGRGDGGFPRPDDDDGGLLPRTAPAGPGTLSPSDFPADVHCEIDLVANRFGCRRPDAIHVFEGPHDGQVVVKVVLDPRGTEMTRARFEVLYGDQASGWTVNIGDSPSNNGWGGDSSDQTRDSELQVLDGALTVICDDVGLAALKDKNLLALPDFARPGDTVTFEVENNRLVYWNNRGSEGNVDSPYLFCLAGQDDKEGPVNYDLFAGFNRVVQGGRTGTGVKRVRITLFPK